MISSIPTQLYLHSLPNQMILKQKTERCAQFQDSVGLRLIFLDDLLQYTFGVP